MGEFLGSDIWNSFCRDIIAKLLSVKEVLSDLSVITKIVEFLLAYILCQYKNKYSIRERKKEMNSWIKRGRRRKTFIDFLLREYISLFVLVILIQSVNIYSIYKTGQIISTEKTIDIYFVLGGIIILIIYILNRNSVELMQFRQKKIWMMLILYFVFCFGVITELNQLMIKLENLIVIFSLGGWMWFVFKYCDVVYIIDNRFADIYMQGGVIIKELETKTIHYRGGVIIAKRKVNSSYEEFRIKEGEITQIKYYGDIYIDRSTIDDIKMKLLS